MNNIRNPYSGHLCSGIRFRFKVKSIASHTLYLPIEMKDSVPIRRLIQGDSPLLVFDVHSIQAARKEFAELRKRFDFDFWAVKEFLVTDMHDADRVVPLRLNDCQLHVIDIMRKGLSAHRPGRYIVTKSFRRCGLTTCIQAYILWMQIYINRNHSYVCGPSEISLYPLKTNIYRFLHRDYIPKDMSVFIPKVDRCAFFNTFKNPDAIRGISLAFAHFSDMSHWNDPQARYASRAYYAASSAVLYDHRTLVVQEGNIPKKSDLDLVRYVRNCPKMKYAARTASLANKVRNPDFLCSVINSLSDQTPYFYPIHLDISFSNRS